MELPTAVGLAAAVLVGASVIAVVFLRSSQSTRKGETSANGSGKHAEDLKAEEEDSAQQRVRILYGTQTGTAERFSKQLAGELRKKVGSGTVVDVVDLENYRASQQLPKEQLVVFCVATYGDGEPTDNAAEFFSWLTKEVEAVESGEKSATLKGVTFAVFGLGNKQYEHFNAVGKKLHAGLETLGATAIVQRGDGDDDGCIDEDFDKWTAEFFTAFDASDLAAQLVGTQLENGAVESSSDVLEVEVLPAGSAELLPFPDGGTGRDHHSPYWATISTARELHGTASDRSCVHVEINLSNSGITYEAGDHVAIFAQNSVAIVEEVAALLGQDLGTVFVLKSSSSGSAAPFTGPFSVKTALSFFADLLSSPRKDALEALAKHASDPAEAARLSQLASHDGKHEYAEFIAKPHRSLLEVLRAFPSAKPPLGAFFGSIAPRLQPRFYSISSAPEAHPTSIHVTCSVVRDLMPTGRIHEGVASTWLQQQVALGPGSKVPIFVRRSHFRLPTEASRPVVMVGPGTGLAPFRGFIQQRAALLAKGVALGPAVLFFGCRNREHDFIYREELQEAVASGALTHLHVAFSRDGPAKDYVQHHMERESALVWSLLGEQQGHLYVCGDAKNMAKDVHRAVLSIVAKGKDCSNTAAEAWVKELQDASRYQRDVW